WVKERLNMIMIVAALVAGIAYQALINPPGGVFQEDSKIDSITDPVMFTYYLKSVIGNHAMSQGFQSYINNLPPQITATGNITAHEIVTYRANFVKDLLAAAKCSESLVRSLFPYMSHKAPGIVLEDAWWMNITSKYNTTYGAGGSGFSPYLIRYAGTAILAYRSPILYEAYVVLNMVSLLLCAFTIGTIVFDITEYKPISVFVRPFEVMTAIAVGCILASSTLVANIISPPFYVSKSRDTKVGGVWLGSMFSSPFAALIFILVLKVVDRFCIKKRFGVQPFVFENRIHLYYGPINH
ncbi:hypothetical protein MKW94_015302, partial [Papaver nudicaule]|nr:hypothetical protein [Papaver nudicaule]